MKYTKRIVSLFLLLAVTVGSAAALTTVKNPNPKILSIKVPYSDGVEENDIIVHTNFTTNLSESATPNEVPQMYRSANNGKFRAIPRTAHDIIYSWDEDKEHDRKTFMFYDLSCKNGTYYRYKFATTTVDPSTGKQTPVAYSNVKAHYYLKRMSSTYLSIKNSANKKSMTISWKKQCNPKADGYQLRYYYYTRYATHPKVSKYFTRTVKGAKTSKYTLKHRSPNKQYLVQIRSYKKYKGTTYYSNWSDHARRYV